MPSYIYPLFLTVSVQCVVSFGMVALPVLLPAYAKEIGVGAGFAGFATASVYGGAAVTAYLLSARVRSAGSIRSCQLALLTVAAGIGLAACDGLVMLLLGSAVLGLGYGPITAASASLLTRSAPASAYGIVFSVNRISIPLGSAAAGAVLPALTGHIGWRAMFFGIGVICAAVAILLQAARRIDTSDAHRPSLKVSPRWGTPWRLLFDHPKRRVLTQASLAFLAAQSCLAAFTVTYLVEEHSMSFVKAGAILAASQIAGLVSRLVLGVISDRSRRGMLLLGSVGVATAAATCLTAASRGSWPDPIVVAIFLLYGAGALGWNGIMLAELAHTVPNEDSAGVTGASSSISFAGAAVGPIVFSTLLDSVGYGGAYLLLTLIVLTCSVLLLRFDSGERVR